VFCKSSFVGEGDGNKMFSFYSVIPTWLGN
jgi:hypothetical protein